MEEKKQKRAKILRFIKNNKIKTQHSQSPCKKEYLQFENNKYSQKKQNHQAYQLFTDRALNNKKVFLQIPRQYSNQNLTLKSKFKFLLEENFKKILENTQIQQNQQKENNFQKNKYKFRINNQKDKNLVKKSATEIKQMKFRKLLKQELKITKYLLNLLEKSNKEKKKKSKKIQDIYIQQSFQLLLQNECQNHNIIVIKNSLILNRYLAFFIENIQQPQQIEAIQKIINYFKNQINQIITESDQLQTQTSNVIISQQNQIEKNCEDYIEDIQQTLSNNTKYNIVLFTYLKKHNVNIDNFSILLSSIKRALNTQPKYPIKEERNPELKYTLFLDLDETLIHFDPYRDLNKIHFRPFVHKFLQEMSQFYELIIFTAGKKEYADWAIDNLDKDNLIRHRLYQRHTKQKDGVYLKDINSTGRSLKDSIIIDNLKENFSLHENNGIEIISYEGQKGDKELLKLIPILKQVASTDQGNISYTLQRILNKSN